MNDETMSDERKTASFIAHRLSLIDAYRDRRILAILLLGFSSGLPLALTASTLMARLTDAGVNLSAIGLFAAVATPYTLKFLWSPLVDGLDIPLLRRLGHRRGWLLAMQLALAAAIALLGMTDPAASPWATALLALLVAFFSATQDIVIDAYRVEILRPEQYGAGAAVIVLGYRLGMIASSAGPLFLFKSIGWVAAYGIMAALMGVGILTVLLSPEPSSPPPTGGGRLGGGRSCSNASNEQEGPHPNPSMVKKRHPDVVFSTIEPMGEGISHWLKHHVLAPFIDFMTRPHWLAILLFILLYKLADAFMGVMTNPFLLKIGFTGPQIATILKIYGVAATIAGSFAGGWLVARLGTWRSLWICGVAHMLTNFLFVALAHAGPDTRVLTLAITLENVSGGMGTAAFVAFLSGLCNRHFTATQYALLSSFSAFGRTWLSTPAGWLAARLGWAHFFTLAALLALPGLMVLWYLGRRDVQAA